LGHNATDGIQIVGLKTYKHTGTDCRSAEISISISNTVCCSISTDMYSAMSSMGI